MKIAKLPVITMWSYAAFTVVLRLPSQGFGNRFRPIRLFAVLLVPFRAHELRLPNKPINLRRLCGPEGEQDTQCQVSL